MFGGASPLFNVQLWVESWGTWIRFMIGPGGSGQNQGLLWGAIILFVAIVVAERAIYFGQDSLAALFGGRLLKRTTRNQAVEFAGVGTVWGSEREVNDLLKMGNYQELRGKETTTDYVSVDDQGHEQSRIKVHRWSGD